MSAPDNGRRRPPGKRPPRWGLRTLGFLALAMVSIITSNVMGHYTVGSFGSLLVGLIGAAICSVRGIRTAMERGLLQRR